METLFIIGTVLVIVGFAASLVSHFSRHKRAAATRATLHRPRRKSMKPSSGIVFTARPSASVPAFFQTAEGIGRSSGSSVKGIVAANSTKFHILDSAGYEIAPGELYLAGVFSGDGACVETYRWAVEPESIVNVSEPFAFKIQPSAMPGLRFSLSVLSALFAAASMVSVFRTEAWAFLLSASFLSHLLSQDARKF